MHLCAICPIEYTLQYGKDPAELDAAPEASQALNFSFERYAPHLPALRAARTEADIKELGGPASFSLMHSLICCFALNLLLLLLCCCRHCAAVAIRLSHLCSVACCPRIRCSAGAAG